MNVPAMCYKIIPKKTDGTSRQTQAGIGHSAPEHRGRHVQNRIRRRQVRRGKIEHSSKAEQPRTDGGPGRQGKACQHRRGRGLAGAHRSRHPKKERRNKIQTPQLHVPRGHTAQGSCRVEQERDNTSRGSNNGDTTGRKRRQQHRLRVVRPRAHPEEVIPEKGKWKWGVTSDKTPDCCRLCVPISMQALLLYPRDAQVLNGCGDAYVGIF